MRNELNVYLLIYIQNKQFIVWQVKVQQKLKTVESAGKSWQVDLALKSFYQITVSVVETELSCH